MTTRMVEVCRQATGEMAERFTKSGVNWERVNLVVSGCVKTTLNDEVVCRLVSVGSMLFVCHRRVFNPDRSINNIYCNILTTQMTTQMCFNKPQLKIII